METEQLGGFLLTFDPKQMKLIKDKLIEWDYPPDSDGLKDLILDTMKEPDVKPEHRVGVMIGDFIAQNPEVLASGAKMAGNIVKQFVKRKVSGR